MPVVEQRMEQLPRRGDTEENKWLFNNITEYRIIYLFAGIFLKEAYRFSRRLCASAVNKFNLTGP